MILTRKADDLQVNSHTVKPGQSLPLVLVACQLMSRAKRGEGEGYRNSQRDLYESVNCYELRGFSSHHQHDNCERDAGESIGTLGEVQNGGDQPKRKDRRTEHDYPRLKIARQQPSQRSAQRGTGKAQLPKRPMPPSQWSSRGV